MPIKKKYNDSSAKGMALVMALLILSLIMVSALAFARIIMGEVRMSLNLINSIGSFHSANAGMEKALYGLKYSYNNNEFDYFEGLEDAGVQSVYDQGMQKFNIIESSGQRQNYTAYNISTSTPVYVDIIDPGGDISNTTWDPVAINPQVEIKWKINNCFPNHASERLEISYHYFAANFLSIGSEKRIAICNCDYNDDWCQNWTQTITTDQYYRFSLKPLNRTVDRLELTIKDQSAGDAVGVLSRAYVEVEGIYKNSRYRLKVEVPTLAPVSGAFNYVIFSEMPFRKDPIWQ